jgi:hypothetical protein
MPMPPMHMSPISALLPGTPIARIAAGFPLIPTATDLGLMRVAPMDLPLVDMVSTRMALTQIALQDMVPFSVPTPGGV